MKTATFSNGYTDTYKGDRNVTAAWMVIDRKTGKVVGSGHSLDKARAEKTAQGHLRHVSFDDIEGSYYLPRAASYMTKEYAKSLLASLRKHGDWPEGLKATTRSVFIAAQQVNKAAAAAKRERCIIEVIEI